MNSIVKNKFDEQIENAKDFEKKQDFERAWHFLERAHILAQYDAGPHLRVHWLMLRLAIETKDLAEFSGQLVRLLLAAPGSSFKKAPKGNTGRSNVGIFQPMEIPNDLEEVLKGKF
jgi:hypothetical protein